MEARVKLISCISIIKMHGNNYSNLYLMNNMHQDMYWNMH